MAATNTQKQKFNKFIKTNNINVDDLNDTDATEFLETWNISRFKKNIDISEPPKTEEVIEAPEVIEEPVEISEEPIIEPVAPEVEKPTEIDKTQFPEWIFKWPSPVTVDKEGKLSTWFSPLETKKEEVEIEKINEDKNAKTLESFNKLLESWASMDDLSNFAKDNQWLKKEFRSALRDKFKNQANLDFVQTYQSASNEQLKSALKNKDIVIGSKQYNLLPDSVKAKISAFDTMESSTKKKDFWPDEKIISLGSLQEEITKLFSTDLVAKSNELMSNPELNKTREDLEWLQNEISNLDDERDRLEEDIKEEFPHASQSKLNSIIRERSKNMVREKNGLVNQYNAKLWTYSDMKNDIQSELEMFKFEDQQKKAAFTTALNIYQTDRARMDKLELKRFETESNRIAMEKEMEFKREIIEREEEFARADKKWIYQTDTKWNLLYIVDGVAEIVKWDMWNVVMWEEVEGHIEKTYQNKEGWYDVIRTYKDGRKPTITSFGANWKSATWWTISIQDTIDNCRIEGQCGEWVNDYLQNLGLPRVMGDSYESKKRNINSQDPVIWGVAVWNAWTTENGHTWLITWYNEETGNLLITDWNYNWDEKQMTHEVSPSTIEATWGYYIPNVPKQEEPSPYSQEAQDWAVNISKGQANIANVPSDIRTEVSSALANTDITLDEDNPIIAWLRGQFDIASEIVDWETDKDWFFEFDTSNESLIEDVSGGVQISPFDSLTGGKGQILSKIQFLLDEQPLQKLIDVKAQWASFGALSEKELALLTKSSSLLNSAAKRNDEGQLTWFKLSEQDVKKHLRILRDGYKKAIEKKTWVQSLDIDDINKGLEIIQVDDLSWNLDF